MPDPPLKKVQVKMRRIPHPHLEAPPHTMNKALFAAVDREAILELGYVDVREAFEFIHKAQTGQEPEEPAEVSFHVIARFSVSPQAAVELLRVANGMVGHFQRHGYLPSDLAAFEGIGQSAEVRLGSEETPDGTPTS